MSDEMHTNDLSLNKSKAISLAESSDQFKSKIQGYNVTFWGTFQQYHLNETACSVTLTGVNAAYYLTNKTGSYVANLVVTLDPTITKILSVSEYTAPRFGGYGPGGPGRIANTPEFPFVTIILTFSIVSAILLYRFKYTN